MKWSSVTGPEYLNVDDIPENGINVQIQGVLMMKVGTNPRDNTKKPVMRLHGLEKLLVLNKHRIGMLEAAFGEEMEACFGKNVRLFRDAVMIQDEMQATIGIESAEPEQQRSATPVPMP